MKRFLFVAALASMISPALAADIGVSLTIGQPGFYGQIDIGDFPQPRVIYRQPRIVDHISINRPPIYLHVPPGHARDWRKHCGRYNACGERVYFVQEQWYSGEYIPHYQSQYRNRQDDNRDKHHEERRERNDDHRGKGHGKGHDKHGSHH